MSKKLTELTAQIRPAFSASMLKKMKIPSEEQTNYANYKLFPVDIIIKAEWNYKEEDEATSTSLRNNLKRIGQVENTQVRLLDTGYYEMINGNHRYDEIVGLGKRFIMAYDHGAIGLQEAIRIAVETNETKFKADPIELAGRIKELDDVDIMELEQTMPYSMTELEEFLNFDPTPAWNPPKTPEAEAGDGINELVGYGLQSFWKDISNENSEFNEYMIPLPKQNKGADMVRQKHSRTNLEEIRRIILTYMREGDYFLENCCGWSTFACSAVLHGFNGVGVDIWDVAVKHGRKQYSKLKHVEGLGKYTIKQADAMQLPFEDNSFDFVYCNPPFMDEEKYSGLDNDIATKDKDDFANKFTELMRENFRVLKPDNLCIITINDKREKGYLEPLQAKVIEWGYKAGFKLHDFVVAEVLSQKIRLRKKDYQRRRTVKCHEYIIVFRKP